MGIFEFASSTLVACVPIYVTKGCAALRRVKNSHLNCPVLQNFNNNEKDSPPSMY
jgi:hypothetical protein